MKFQKSNSLGGLLLNVKLRPSGEMMKEGRKITWETRTILYLLPYEEDRTILKYPIAPTYEKQIIALLEDVHWGTLVEIELNNKEVVHVTVVEDLLKDFIETQL